MKKILLSIFIVFVTFCISMVGYGRIKYSKPVKYEVEHYLENIDDDNYSLKETTTLKGKNKKLSEASYLEYEGFSGLGEIEQITLDTDKENVVKLYYLRNKHSLTITNDDNCGTVNNVSGTYKFGSSITLTVSLNEGYVFDGWYLDNELVSEELSYTFTMPNKDVNYTTRYKEDSYNLSLKANISEAGNLSGEESYQYKGNVTIKATVNPGYTFIGWFDGEKLLSNNLEYNFIMPNKNVNYQANYSINEYNVTLNKNIDEAGSVTGNNTYQYKENVTVGVTVNDGYTFIGWYIGEDLKCDNNTYEFTMPYEDVLLEARYEINSYTVTLSKNIDEAGDITGNGVYAYLDTVTLTATSNSGYTFSGWYKDNLRVSIDAEYSFIMPYSDVTYEARWNTNSYNVTVNKNIDEAGTIIGAGDYDYNTQVTLTAQANKGYTFIGWFKNDEKVNDELTYKFMMPHEDIVLEARFGYDSFNLTLSTNLEDAGELTGANTYLYKDSVTVSATANIGFIFVGWYVGSTIVSTAIEYTFTMPNEDYELVATYIYEIYELTLTQNMEEAGSVSGDKTYAYKDSVTVTTTLEGGYVFVGWFVNDELKSEELSYTFTMPNSDLTIEVRYAYYTVTVIKNIDEAGTIPEYNETKVRPGFTVNLVATEENSYSFMGWYIDNVLKTPNYTYNYIMDASNVVIEARYTSYTLTVTKNFDFGTVSDYTDVKVTANSSVTLTATTNEGYSFVGWYIGEQLIDSNKEYEFIMPCSSVTIEARFTYYTLTVEIDNEEAGTVSDYVNVKVEDGSEISVTVTLNDVYYLVGWYIGEELMSEELTYTFNMPKENIVIVAKTIYYTLTINQRLSNGLDSAYLVTFDSQGGTSVLSQYSNNLEYPKYITKEGYCFGGWYRDSECTGNPFDFKNDVITEDTTLYARWVEADHIIQPNGGVEEYLGGTGSWSEWYMYIACETKQIHFETYNSGRQNGYVLYIYDQDKNELMHKTHDRESVYMQTYYNATAGEVIYLRYYMEYEDGIYGWIHHFQALIYDKTGLPGGSGYDYADTGEYNTSSKTYVEYINTKVKVGRTIKLTAAPKNGTTFIGWYEGETLLSTNTTYNLTMEARNMNVYAKYIYYTLTTENLNDDLGTITSHDHTKVKVGETVTLTATPNEDCAFLGWYDIENNLISDSISYQYTMADIDVKFIAKFVPITITLNKTIEEAGTVSISDNLVLGKDATITATVNYGYIFTGWFNSSDELVSSTLTYIFTLEETNIYTAKYIVNKVSITKNIDEAASITDFEFGYVLNQELELTVTIVDGYTWYGWFLNNELLTKDLTVTITVTEETKAYELRFGKYVLSIETNYLEAYQDYATITYESNGGSEVASQKTHELKYITPSKEGYVFAGWFKDAELENEYLFDESINEDITLYAKWVELPEKELIDGYEKDYLQTVGFININQTIGVGNITLEPNGKIYGFIPLVSGTITFKLSNYEVNPGWGENIYLYIFGSKKEQLLEQHFYFYEPRNGKDKYKNAEVTYEVTKGELYFISGKRNNGNNVARNIKFQVVGEIPQITNFTSRNGDILELGQTINIVAQEKEGYDFVGWYSDSEYNTLVTTNRYYSFTMPESSVTYYAKYKPEEVDYTVYYHLENADNEEYSDGGSDVFSGATSTLTNAVAKPFTNYTPEEFEQVTIHGDGSSEVHIYYKRNKFNLTINVNDELAGINDGVENGSYKFGSTLTIKGKANAGYTYTGVLVNDELHEGSFILEMPESDVTVTLVFTPNTNTKYKLIYHREALNGGYMYNTEEETLYGTTNSVIVVTKTYYGFTLVPFEETRIKGDGSTVLDVYFDRNNYTVTIVLADKVHSRLESTGFTYNEEKEEYTKLAKYEEDVSLELDANEGYAYDCWFINDERISEYWKTSYEVTGDVTIEARISPYTECPYVVQFYIQNNINEYLNDPTIGRTWTYSTSTSRWTGVTDQMTQETEESLQNVTPAGFEVFEINNVIYDYEADNVYVIVYCTPKLLKLTISRNNYYDNSIQFDGVTILPNGNTLSTYVEVYHGQTYTLKLIFDEAEHYDTMSFDGWYNPEDDSRIPDSGVLENTFTANSNDDFEVRAIFDVKYVVTYSFRAYGQTSPQTVGEPETKWGRCGGTAEFSNLDLYDGLKNEELYDYYETIMYYNNGTPCTGIGMSNASVSYMLQEVPKQQ